MAALESGRSSYDKFRPQEEQKSDKDEVENAKT